MFLNIHGEDTPTKDIIEMCHQPVSERTVQQVRKDYKSEIQKTSDEFYAVWAEESAKTTKAKMDAAKAEALVNGSNLEYICEGCDRADTTNYRCTVYVKPPSMYVRGGCCPFNKPTTTKKKVRVRVGQQKTNR
jgi:hypothetical protein